MAIHHSDSQSELPMCVMSDQLDTTGRGCGNRNEGLPSCASSDSQSVRKKEWYRVASVFRLIKLGEHLFAGGRFVEDQQAEVWFNG